MRGRKPKPTALKLLAGNPGRRPLNAEEPQFELIEPEIPSVIQENKEAIEEWNRVVPQLQAAGILTKIDRTALVGYCICYARWMDAERKIQQYGCFTRTKTGYMIVNPYISLAKQCIEQLAKFMSDFGMTPAARVRLKAMPVPTKGNSIEDDLFGT